MSDRPAIVVTTVNPPSEALRRLAEGAVIHDYDLIVIGDVSTPPGFQLPGAHYLDVDQQRRLSFRTAALCPTRSYARKNIGYLEALARGAAVIIETDDDNLPLPTFWCQRTRRRTAAIVEKQGWVNVYSYFSNGSIWPRGLPLTEVKTDAVARDQLENLDVDAPIQQGLANGDPDVDAVYRMIAPLPFEFKDEDPIALGKGAWCPFNSQNTSWWREAATLLYLPATCSMRMTDIWRSLVARRIAQACDWSIVFASASMFQVRNNHDLLQDFIQEIPGYVYNNAIVENLSKLDLAAGIANIPDNLRVCYKMLVDANHLKPEELVLLQAWIEDCNGLMSLQMA